MWGLTECMLPIRNVMEMGPVARLLLFATTLYYLKGYNYNIILRFNGGPKREPNDLIIPLVFIISE